MNLFVTLATLCFLDGILTACITKYNQCILCVCLGVIPLHLSKSSQYIKLPKLAARGIVERRQRILS